MAEIKYSPKAIYEQDFKISMRGYNKEEVDDFLDGVIRDYEAYAAIIGDLEAQNKRLRKELESKPTISQKTEMMTPSFMKKSEPVRPATATTAVTNFDILKRISRLEKEVFGKQIIE